MSAIQQLFNDYCPPFKKSQVKTAVGDVMNALSRDYCNKWMESNRKRANTAVFDAVGRFSVFTDAMQGQGWKGYQGDQFSKIYVERLWRYWEGQSPEDSEIALMQSIDQDIRRKAKQWEQIAANAFLRSIGQKPQYAPGAVTRPRSEFKRTLNVAWRDQETGFVMGPGPLLRVRAMLGASVILEWFLSEAETEIARWGDMPSNGVHRLYKILLPFGINPDAFQLQLVDSDDGTTELIPSSFTSVGWGELTPWPEDGPYQKLLAACVIDNPEETIWEDDSIQYLGNWHS